jgi:hypothetical protein
VAIIVGLLLLLGAASQPCDLVLEVGTGYGHSAWSPDRTVYAYSITSRFVATTQPDKFDYVRDPAVYIWREDRWPLRLAGEEFWSLSDQWLETYVDRGPLAREVRIRRVDRLWVRAADFDGDGDADQADFGVLQACLDSLDVSCIPCDLSGDGAVDGRDVELFVKAAGGPGMK